jgi:hypothetical protein
MDLRPGNTMALCFTYRPSQPKAAAGSHAVSAATSPASLPNAQRPLRPAPARAIPLNLSCVDLLTAF